MHVRTVRTCFKMAADVKRILPWLLLVILAGTLSSAEEIKTFAAIDLCNKSVDLQGLSVHIGIIKYTTDPSSTFYIHSNCKIHLIAQEHYKLGLQLVKTPSHTNTSDCDSKLVITTGDHSYIQCLDNDNSVLDEVTSEQRELTMEFIDNFEDIANNTEEVENAVETNFVEVTVVFYSFTPKTENGACDDDENLQCVTSPRCVHSSLYDHVQKYNICQSPEGVSGSDVIEDPEMESSFLGVAVFAATLVILFIVLIVMNFIQKRSVCRVCRSLLCLDYDDTENLDGNRTSERPIFSLGDPPPSYSDLSSIEGYTNPGLDRSDSLPSPTERNEQTGIWIDNVNNLGLPKTMSEGRLSIASGGTLPPSYSDVIIHQDKYQVHT